VVADFTKRFQFGAEVYNTDASLLDLSASVLVQREALPTPPLIEAEGRRTSKSHFARAPVE
jgi:hypothetical protein